MCLDEQCYWILLRQTRRGFAASGTDCTLRAKEGKEHREEVLEH